MINVQDEEILEAMRSTGRLTGIFAEPAAATAVAGVRRAVEDGNHRTQGERSRRGHRQRPQGHTQRPVRGHECPSTLRPMEQGLEEILEERDLIS
jgi:hypothetical protein